MNELEKRLVVIGTGSAGTELAFAARASGWRGPIVMVGEEAVLPYHRPPLSKAYLTGDASADSLCIKAAAMYQKLNIELIEGVYVTLINREDKLVRLSDARTLPYDQLALTTGGRPRPLPAATADVCATENFHYLRTAADADAMRRNFGVGRRLVVVGGGYVGLEVAAAAVKLGLLVTLLEAAPRVLARVTAPILSTFYEEVHRQAGVQVHTGTLVEGFELSPDKSKITAVLCGDGVRIEADVVVAGIGLLPNSELASSAGLEVADGIVVDARMRTLDDAIVSAGDCTRFHSTLYERSLRVESVPNALEQARKIAALLCGKVPRPDAAPWFWSDQYDLNLKMVGLSQGYDQLILRGSLEDRSFSAFYMQGQRVLAVDTVNRPLEFIQSKRLVNEQLPVDPLLLADDTIPFKRILGITEEMAT